MTAVLDHAVLDPAAYAKHALHSSDRTWTELNCYLDLWVELLHSLGLDPRPASVCALSAGFLGDQWTFLKHDPADLRTLYGIEVGEITVWRPVLDHVREHLAAGRLLTVEVDSWYLPDTAGVAYRRVHEKTTIVPVTVDPSDRTMTYFHNAGLFALDGEDFAGVFARPALPPYIESLRLDRLRRNDDLVADTIRLAGEHLARRPAGNPVLAMGERISADLPWLVEQDPETFHVYSFGMLRQCGGTAALAADLATWLSEHGEQGLEPVVEHFTRVSDGAKSAQFQLARLARGRAGSLDAVITEMASAWQAGTDAFAARYAQ